MNNSKHKAKRLSVALLIAVLAVSTSFASVMTGCGNKDESSSTAATVTSTASAAENTTVANDKSESELNTESSTQSSSSNSTANSSQTSEKSESNGSSDSSKTESKSESSKNDASSKNDTSKNDTSKNDSGNKSSDTLSVDGHDYKKGDTVTVTYTVKSTKVLANFQGTITYDSSKLKLDVARSKDFMPNVSNEVTNIKTGRILSNFTDITDLKDFTNKKTFVRAYFNVIGTGSTTVDLNLKTLCVGFIDNDLKVNFAAVVRNSEVQSGVTSVAGYEKLAINKNTKAYLYSDDDVMLGDVTGDGQIDVNDVTAIQLYIAQNQSFTDKQKEAADVNKDGKISVLDVTRVQQYIARYFDEF